MASKGVEALFQASSDCKLRLVRLLVEGGTPVDTRNNEQLTPIMMACNSDSDREDKEKVVQFLLKMNAKVNLQDINGKTALIFACLTNSNSVIISSLLSSSANPWIEDKENNSAFDYAINTGNLETIKMLVDACRKNQSFRRESYEAEMRRLEECLVDVQDARKLSWPLMSHLWKAVTSKKRNESMKEAPALNTSRQTLAVVDEVKGSIPPAQRRRKRSICHFGPIDIEAIQKANDQDEDTPVLTSAADSKPSDITRTDHEVKTSMKISELGRQMSRKESVTRTGSEDEKISLHFSEDESDNSSYSRQSSALLGLEKLLQFKNSFSSMSSGSLDMTDATTIVHPLVIQVEGVETTPTSDSKTPDPEQDANEANPYDSFGKNVLGSKINEAGSSMYPFQDSNLLYIADKEYKSDKENCAVIKESDIYNSTKLNTLSEARLSPPRTPENLLPKSLNSSPAVSPRPSPRTRRKTLSVNDYKRIEGAATQVDPNNGVARPRRYTVSSMPQLKSSQSPKSYNSEINLSPTLCGIGREEKNTITRRKCSHARMLLKQEACSSYQDYDGGCIPTNAEKDWALTLNASNERACANFSLSGDSTSYVQLPNIPKRVNGIPLEETAKLQQVENSQKSNEKESKAAKALKKAPLTNTGARRRRKSRTESPECVQRYQSPISDSTKQTSNSDHEAMLNSPVIQQRSRSLIFNSKCNIVSMTTTGYDTERADSGRTKLLHNPLPDLLSHSGTRSCYSPQPPPHVDSPIDELPTNFLDSSQESTASEVPPRMTGDCTLPEVVSPARSPRARHVALLPPLIITTARKSTNESEEGYFSCSPSPFDDESPNSPIFPRPPIRTPKLFLDSCTEKY